MPFCSYRQATLGFRSAFSQLFRRPAIRPRTTGVRLNSTTSETASNLAAYNVRKEPWITPMMFLVGIMPILTFSLGTWQVSRLKWKIALIDELEEKLQQDPLRLPPRINLDAIPEFVFRKVIISGQWDHAHTMFLRPRVNDGVHGVHVVTPLIRDNGTTLLVDRGFVSNEVADAQSFGKPTGQVTLLGMIRTSQTRNTFTPDNDPSQNSWYWTDVNAMAEQAGGQSAQVQPVFIEEIFEGDAGEAQLHLHNGMPLGRPPTVDIRNAHLSYIVTWYALSAFTTVMFAGVVRNRRRFVSKRLPR